MIEEAEFEHSYRAVPPAPSTFSPIVLDRPVLFKARVLAHRWYAVIGPSTIWLAAIGSGLIAVPMSFFLLMKQAVPQTLVTSIMASTIALLLCVTYVLSHPFAGPLALPPEAFLHTLQVFASVDATR